MTPKTSRLRNQEHELMRLRSTAFTAKNDVMRWQQAATRAHDEADQQRMIAANLQQQLSVGRSTDAPLFTVSAGSPAVAPPPRPLRSREGIRVMETLQESNPPSPPAPRPSSRQTGVLADAEHMERRCVEMAWRAVETRCEVQISEWDSTQAAAARRLLSAVHAAQDLTAITMPAAVKEADDVRLQVEQWPEALKELTKRLHAEATTATMLNLNAMRDGDEITARDVLGVQAALMINDSLNMLVLSGIPLSNEAAHALWGGLAARTANAAPVRVVLGFNAMEPDAARRWARSLHKLYVGRASRLSLHDQGGGALVDFEDVIDALSGSTDGAGSLEEKLAAGHMLSSEELKRLKGVASMDTGATWPPEVPELLARGAFVPKKVNSAMPSVVLLSGASEGADTLFGEAAQRAGHGVLHVLGPRNTPSDDAAVGQAKYLVNVSDSLLDGDLVSPAFERAAAERGIFPDGGAFGTLEDWRDSRRNFLQVAGADCVYAVAYRLKPSDEAPSLDIGGGTGLAVQLYVDRFEPRGPEPASSCKLFFYDDGAPNWDGCLKDPATHRKWNKWNPLMDAWEPLERPPLLPKTADAGSVLYAGIGSTLLDPDYGAHAIAGLYAQVVQSDALGELEEKLANGHMLSDEEMALLKEQAATNAHLAIESLSAKLSGGHMLSEEEMATLREASASSAALAIESLSAKLANGHMLNDEEMAMLREASASSASLTMENLEAKLADGHMLSDEEMAELKECATTKASVAMDRLTAKLADGHMLSDEETAQLKECAAMKAALAMESVTAKLAEGHMLSDEELAMLHAASVSIGPSAVEID